MNNPFVLYEKNLLDKAPVIGNRFKLPFGVVIEKYFELEEEEQVLEQEDARELAHKMAMDKISEMVPEEAEIVDKQVQIITEEGKEYILITVECTEDIAMQQEIGGN